MSDIAIQAGLSRAIVDRLLHERAARIAARAMGILTAMNETLPLRSLDNALTVPGFETKRDDHRVVFTSTAEPRRVVIWRVSEDALTQHVASLRPHARAAWGARSARGEWLLAVHVEEALLTFEGDRGEMVMSPGGLRVRPLE
jgi:hypothetical protein